MPSPVDRLRLKDRIVENVSRAVKQVLLLFSFFRQTLHYRSPLILVEWRTRTRGVYQNSRVCQFDQLKPHFLAVISHSDRGYRI